MTAYLLPLVLLGNGVAAGVMLSTVIGVVPMFLTMNYGPYVRSVQFLWPRYDPFMPILNGVTRAVVFDIIHREGYRLVERPFTVAEAKAAREAFLTSTTADLLPVVRIDGAPIGDGKPGPLSRRLRDAYQVHAAAAA